jgi:hypothetical protein
VNTAGTDEIADLLISEIRDGMYEYDPADPFKVQSNIRAGIIKIAKGERGLTVEDGGRYFIYGWTQVIGEVFSFEIDAAAVERLCCAAREIVGRWD